MLRVRRQPESSVNLRNKGQHDVTNGLATKRNKSIVEIRQNFFILLFFLLIGLVWKQHWFEDSNSQFEVSHPSHLDDKSTHHGEGSESKNDFEEDVGEAYHLIFSTDCSEFQHWQSYVLFYSAFKVRQPGYVTRIVSGCSEKEEITAKEWHEENIQSTMSSRFLIHFTPHFSGVKSKDGSGEIVGNYKFYNKPFGLKHWMQHGETMGFLEGSNIDGNGKMKNEDLIVILLDPDMALLRPITGDFSNDRDVVIGRRASANRKYKVQHGQPFAQTYGFGAQWQKLNLDNIAGPNSPAKDVTRSQGGTFYPVGPPYLATARDMYAIALKWTEFVPKVYDEHPKLMAEMFAFCIAAAHLKLPHQIIDSLMISNSHANGEGWPMIDKIPTSDICEFAKKPSHEVHPVPSVIHFCQRYNIQEWFFGKRKMTKNFFTCESPLFEEPPSQIMEGSQYILSPGDKQRKEVSEVKFKREGFIVCGIIALMNEAAVFFKEHNCSNKSINIEQTLNLAKPTKTKST